MKSTYLFSALLALLFFTSCEKETPAIVEEDLNGFDTQPPREEIISGKYATIYEKPDGHYAVTSRGEEILINRVEYDSIESRIDKISKRSGSAPHKLSGTPHNYPNVVFNMYTRRNGNLFKWADQILKFVQIWEYVVDYDECGSGHWYENKVFVHTTPNTEECEGFMFAVEQGGNAIDFDTYYFGRGVGPVNYFRCPGLSNNWTWVNESGLLLKFCNGNGDNNCY